MKRLFLVIMMLPILIFAVNPESELQVEKAWEAWQTNDLDAVEEHFQTAVDLDETNARAYIGLTLLYYVQHNYESGWEVFEKALKYNDDIYPYIYSLIITPLIVDNKQNAKTNCLKYLEEVAQEGDSSGVLKAILYNTFTEYYKSKKKLSKARQYVKDSNTIANWMLIGPFENVSASGYDKIYPPELEYDPAAEYEGKEKVPSFWFQNTATDLYVWIDYMNHFGTEEAVFYANCFVYSPTKQTAQIRTGTSGSLKVFLNDNSIFEIYDENNNAEDSYVVETELQEGWNRLLIKTGYSEIDNCNFYARFTDAGGESIDGLEYSLDNQDYISKPDAPVNEIENFAFEYFKKQIELHPEYPENYVLLASSYFVQDKAIEAELILKEILETMPECSLIHYFLFEAYARGEKSDEVVTTSEKLFNMNKTLPLALTYKFGKYLGNKEYDKVEEILELIDKTSLDRIGYYNNLIQYYAVRELYDKMLTTVDEAYEAYPNVLEFAYLKALVSFEMTKKYSNAIKIMKKVVKKDYSTDALGRLSDFYLKDGDINNWKLTREKLIELAPDAPGFRSYMSDIYLELQNYDEAEKYMLEAIDIVPTFGYFWSKLGQIYRHAKKNDEAILAFQNALLYDRNDYDAIDNIRELQSKGSIFNSFETNNIDELIIDTPSHDEYPNDNSLILLMDKKRVVYPQGGTITENEMLVKVFDQDGIETFQEYSIGYNPYKQVLVFEEAVVIKQDGARIQGDINGYRVVFKTLEPNDIIYMKWKLKNYQSGEMFGHFWDTENMSLFIPAKTIRYSLLVPKDREFQYKTVNTEIEPQIVEMEDNLLYSWENNNESSLDQEYYMPSLDDVGKVLFISSIPDWKFMVDWYQNIASTKTRSSYEIEKAVEDLFFDKPDLSQMEKIKVIYEYIIENITYSSVSFRQSAYVPQDARDVLVNRIGDCKDVSALSIAMLREIGVNAYFALSEPYNYTLNKNQLPSLSVFSHCIVAVETEKGLKYLDHTAQNLDFSTLPTSMIDGCCLPVMEDTNELVFLSDAFTTPSNLIRTGKITIQDDNVAFISKNSLRTGNKSASTRYYYRYKSKQDRDKELLEILVKDHPTAKLIRFDLPDLDELTYETEYEYDFTIENFTTKVGSYHILKIPWSDNKESNQGISYEQRKLPFRRWSYTDFYSEELFIILPNEMQPIDLPATSEYECFAGKYTLKFQLEGNTLKCTRILDVLEKDIPPEKYLEFKEFYSNIVKADEMQILLEKK
jgi:tetratricopeptide (TPR) repeat protein